MPQLNESTQTPIRVAVVGCGYWGPNLIRNFRALGAEVVAVDKDEARLRHVHSLFPGIQCTDELHSVIRDVDAVAIATSVKTHFNLAQYALLCDKHVFIEKPMAASTGDCEHLIRLATSGDRTLMVGHTFIYSPAIQKIKEIVDSGELGELRYISSRRLNLGLFQKDINVTWDLAPHDLSIILHLLREHPVSVNCTGIAHITPGIEDVTSLSLVFPDNVTALVQSSWLDPRKVREMTVVGSKKMLVYDDLAPQEKIKVYDTRVDQPRYNSLAEFQYAYHHGDVYSPHIAGDEPLKTECAHFLDCIRTGKKPLTDGIAGREVVRILEAAQFSLKRGESLPL